MDEVARAGAKVSEVFFATHSEYTRGFAAVVKERADRGGVRINSVHALTNQFEPELFGKGVRAHEDAITTFTRVCEAGQVLGAKYYVFHGATRLKPAVKYVFDFGFISSRVNKICAIAQSHGITLTYENVHWAYFSEPSYFEKLAPLCPDLGATLDIKQARQSGRDWREYIDAMGDRLRNVHISDCDAEGNIKLVGRGVFPFPELVGRLHTAGYDGPVMIEQYAGDYDNFEQVADSVKYIQNIIGGNYAN